MGLNGFAAGIGDVAEEPKDWLRKLLSDPGLPGRVLRPVVDGIAEVERSARDRRQASVSCPSKA